MPIGAPKISVRNKIKKNGEKYKEKYLQILHDANLVTNSTMVTMTLLR